MPTKRYRAIPECSSDSHWSNNNRFTHQGITQSADALRGRTVTQADCSAREGRLLFSTLVSNWRGWRAKLAMSLAKHGLSPTWNISSASDSFSRASGSLRSALEFSDSDNEDQPEKEVELTFYNDDGSYKTVVVENNLCSGDLCQILALKNHAPKDGNWSIVEYWADYGIERTVEDHEKVLAVYQSMQQFDGSFREKKLVFRKDFRKYEVFHNPQQFFPAEMVDLGFQQEGVLADPPSLAKIVILQDVVNCGEGCPQVYGHLWLRETNKQVWRKAFFVLRNTQLLFSYKVNNSSKILRGIKDCVKGEDDLQLYADLTQFTVYTTLNAKSHFKAPTEFGLCLRPTGSQQQQQELRCLACDSEKARLCWITAMRLAKYGRKLRENYRQNRVKLEARSQSPKEYVSYQLPNESIRSRVAMDFTGPYGRVVEDPQEAKAIAVAEGFVWKRRRRPSNRQTPCARTGPAEMLGTGTEIPLGSSMPSSTSGFSLIGSGLNSGIHITQPWFHSGLSREEAASLLAKYGTVDGVFVVRESRSKPGIFVLSHIYRNKIYHTQISTCFHFPGKIPRKTGKMPSEKEKIKEVGNWEIWKYIIVPIVDQARGNICFTLDGGKTRFYDLLQLVEFYQLNSGSLPTRLSYYVIQTHLGSSIASSF